MSNSTLLLACEPVGVVHHQRPPPQNTQRLQHMVPALAWRKNFKEMHTLLSRLDDLKSHEECLHGGDT